MCSKVDKGLPTVHYGHRPQASCDGSYCAVEHLAHRSQCTVIFFFFAINLKKGWNLKYDINVDANLNSSKIADQIHNINLHKV